MIGQERILQNIKSEWANPERGNRFVILVGPEGSGKSLIAKEVSRDMIRVDVDVKVAEIRQTISLAYRVASPTVYVIDKGDDLSPSAKNSLLKVTEEPPNRARFILEVRQESSVLATLLSRGKVVRLDPYTPEQIAEYVSTKGVSDKISELLVECCITPGMVDRFLQYDFLTFYEFAQNIVLHIQEVSDTNAFKSASKIAFKEGEEGYDVELLFDLLKLVASRVSNTAVYNNIQQHVKLVRAISKYSRQLKMNGVNKKALYDMFLLEVRS